MKTNSTFGLKRPACSLCGEGTFNRTKQLQRLAMAQAVYVNCIRHWDTRAGRAA